MLEESSARFFVVLPPGFEKPGLYELHRLLSENEVDLPEVQMHPGGFELELPLSFGLALNQYLKIPTRILLRLAQGKTFFIKDYIKLLRAQNWKDFSPLGQVFVSSRSSKLKIKENLADIFRQKTEETLFAEKGSDVYVRFFRDECTISIDTSGEDLYLRGFDKWVGEAPIRDNMAAALLQMTTQGMDLSQPWCVLDPMAGSGTFLLEALQVSQKAQRKFAFENWQLSEGVKHNISKIKGFPLVRTPEVIAFDQDSKMSEVQKHNFLQLGVQSPQVIQRDLIESDKKPALPSGDRVVICNPPLGKRLKIGDPKFFQKILDKVEEDFQPQRIGLLSPRKIEVFHPQYERVREFLFENNSIPLRFSVYLRFQK